MLKLLDNVKQLNFTPADPFSAKITGLAGTWGTERDFAKFYAQSENAALSTVFGNVTLWCSENADFEEIREFLGVMGFGTLQCEDWVMEKLGFSPDDSSFIVKYCGEKNIVKPDYFTSDPDFRQVYDLLTKCGFDMGSFEDFRFDICSRIRKGRSRSGGITEDGKLISCAFRLFEGDKSILLGAVATDPEKRGRGLSSSLVPYLAQDEKPAFLFTRNDGLLEFYKKCGFTCTGRWAVKNKEE